MPIYTFECPKCGTTIEQYVSRHDAGAPLCVADYATLRRVPSMPAPHRFGGDEGKLRTAAKVKARNDAYQAKPDVKEGHMDGVRKRGLLP